MKTNQATITYLENQSHVEVCSIDQLDREIDQILTKCSGDLPVIVTICMHGFEVGLGLGLARSFVHVECLGGPAPYLISVGDPSAKGETAFFLHADHHTEIPNRNLIPLKDARQVVRDFFETARPSSTITWEEV